MDRYTFDMMRICIACFCFVVWQVVATVVHITPLWYDQKTKNWEILVGRNTGTALWTDFDQAGSEDYRVLAKSDIRILTHGRYNEKNAPIAGSVDIVENDQHFLFLPVSERLDYKVLHKKAKNIKKREFAWVPVTVMLGFGRVSDNRKRKPRFITIEPNFRATLRILWPDVLKKFEALAASKKSVPV